MTVVDLDFARRMAENVMRDSVRITRDPEGPRDAVLDRDTGVLVGPGQPFEATVVYDAETTGAGDRALSGMARVRPARASRYETQAGVTYVEGDYFLSLPWDAPDLRPGDDVTIVAAANDPQLEDRAFVVTEVQVQTFVARRRALMRLRT